MPLPPHLRAALLITGGAALFVLLLMTRLLRSMMEDPNFGRGDNPFELIALVMSVLGPVLALGTAVALAFRFKWAMKLGQFSAIALVLAAVSVLVNKAIAGGAEIAPSEDLAAAQTMVGLASLVGAAGLYFLLKQLVPVKR